ncbi:MAG: NF038143 family protein [Desulfobacterales bacterium]
MGNFRTIWKHEVAQADQIAKILLDNKKVAADWKIMLVPVFLYKVYHYRKDLGFTRKNFLFTKQLAYDAAKNIFQGKEQAWEFRRIEIQTKEILDKEKKGFYTEKIRRKQLSEIDLLIKHYLKLFNAKQSKYAEIIKEIYQSKGNYLSFLSTLQKAEQDVIQAAITTMRKGTKRDRREWFQKVRDTTKQVRMAEADQIYT